MLFRSLRMRITRDRVKGTLKLSRAKYVRKVLSRFNIDKAKLGSHFRLCKDQSPKTDKEIKYMSKIPYALYIGSLMYAMVCKRSNIAHTVGVVSRYMSNLSKTY